MIFTNQSIGTDELPKLANHEFIPIEQKYRKYLLFRNLIFFVIMLVILVGLHIFSPIDETPYLLAALYFAIFVLWAMSIAIVILGFPQKVYLLRNHDITYKTGYLFRSTTVVPKNRIQHIEIRQGIMLRMFALSKLVVFTAGGGASDLAVPGLLPETADKLKEEISKKIAGNE